MPDVEKNHLQRNHIYGDAKTIVTNTYINLNEEEADTADVSKMLFSVAIQHYSPDGCLTSVVSLDADNDTLSIRKISYNGRAQQNSWVLTDRYGNVVDSCHYDYDISGFLASEKRFSEDRLYYQINYKTDAMGNVIEMKQDNGEFVLRNTMQYNADGLLIRSDEYSPEDKLFKYTTIEYDNYGDEVNRRVFKRANDIIEYTYTEYDEKGRIIARVYEDKLKNFRENCKYTAHDKFGNWTVEERVIGDQIINIRERKIIYY